MSGFPDSPAPFRPMNPWGRPMPKVKRSPLREPLYQVFVEMRGEKEAQPISPAMNINAAAAIQSAAFKAIDAGVRKDWANPHIKFSLKR